MSGKSSGSQAPPDRPFAEGVLEEARRVAESYHIVLASEGGQWFGCGLEMPSVFGEGRSPNECVADTREALTAAIGAMLEAGQMPPGPRDV